MDKEHNSLTSKILKNPRSSTNYPQNLKYYKLLTAFLSERNIYSDIN